MIKDTGFDDDNSAITSASIPGHGSALTHTRHAGENARGGSTKPPLEMHCGNDVGKVALPYMLVAINPI
jgi:hypothetical protein